jgi:PAS domain S-box-containing protein
MDESENFQQNTQILNDILKYMADAVYLHDDKGRFRLVNNAACSLTGYSRSELLQMHVSDVDPDSKLRDDQANIWENPQVMNPFIIKARHCRKNGTIYHVELHITRLVINGRDYSLAIARDISGQIEAEEKLLESEKKFKTLYNLSPDPFLLLDADTGCIIDANLSALQVFKMSINEIKGLHHSFIYPENMRDFIDQKFRSGISGFFSGPVEIDLTDTCQKILEVRSRIFRMGNKVLMMQNFRDITMRRQEEEKERVNIKNFALFRLAGGVAHHFNNLLTVIMGNIEMIVNSSLVSGDILKSIKSIEKAAIAAADITSRMLIFLGQNTAVLKKIRFNDFFSEIVNEIIGQTDKSIGVKIHITEDKINLKSDKIQLEQILKILIVNGCESMCSSSIKKLEIALEFIDFSNSGDLLNSKSLPGLDKFYVYPEIPENSLNQWACITVSDTGTGMTKEIIKGIFDPFFTDKFTGRGLGLPVLSGLVRAHSGFIAIKSKPNSGSTFKVFLPIEND